MSMSATARAQAAEVLEQHITSLKRAERATKEAIRSARRAQVALLGIATTTHPGGTVDHDHHTPAENQHASGARAEPDA